MKDFHVGIVGPSGAVGQELIGLLHERAFPVRSLRLLGSRKTNPLTPSAFQDLDFVFFATNSAVSKLYIPFAKTSGATIIDLSSAFREDPLVPLIIPEINANILDNHKLIASPNCAATIMLMALFPLHKISKIKRLTVTTYQAASGAGYQAIEDLLQETKAYLEKTPYKGSVFTSPYAFNLFLHDSPLLPTGYLEEEEKIANETRKILDDDSIRITATCVRVPTLRSHAIAINAEFHEPIAKEQAKDLLQKTPGITLLIDEINNRYATPIDASGKDSILVGRIRKDLSQPNTLDLWVVGDQLRKGAALNAVQIAEHLLPVLRG